MRILDLNIKQDIGLAGLGNMLTFHHFLTEQATGCPIATVDIHVNLKNRQHAIDEYGYGPANPNDDVADNSMFWNKKAKMWKCSVENVKTMRCGNCAAFNVSDRIKNCMASGINTEKADNGEAVIEQANLGYCELFHFKCAGDRTCDAWLTGGAIENRDE